MTLRTYAHCIALALPLLPGCASEPPPDQAQSSSSSGLESTSTGGGTETTAVGSSEGSGSSSTGEAGTEGSSTASLDTEGDSTGGEVPTECVMTVFVNFAGATLVGGLEPNAEENRTQLSEMIGEVAAYDGEVDPKEAMAVVAAHFVDLPVCVTDTRPEAAPYTMVMVTPTNPFPAASIAAADCGDARDADIAFVFTDEDADATARSLANFISSTVGTSVGLDLHDADDGDLMCVSSGCSYPPDVDRTFVDACVPLSTLSVCDAEHAVHCPAGEQNAFAELSALLVPR
ncbi:MAG: hypothetical protein ACE37F_36665 [Nannocystaceae bacterium]|nr:hypothetical protein [bacterium]